MTTDHPSLFPDLPDTKGMYRRTDPKTSKAAAESQLEERSEKQIKVLKVLAAYPDGLTDEQLTAICASRYGWHMHKSTARTRRKELVEIALVRDTGKRVVMESGRSAIIWAVDWVAVSKLPAGAADVIAPDNEDRKKAQRVARQRRKEKTNGHQD